MTLPLDQYRQRASAGGILLAMAGVGLRIQSDDQTLLDDARRYFATLSGSAPAGAAIYAIHDTPDIDMARLVDIPPKPNRTVKEAVYEDGDCRVVYKRRTGVAILVRRSEYFIIGDLHTNRNQVYNLAGHVLAAGFLRQGYAMLHAAAAYSEEYGGIAFGALSSGGKSSMALAMVEQGFHFVSNDRLFVRPDSENGVAMLGLPTWPRVNPGTLSQLPSLQPLLTANERTLAHTLSAEELWQLEQKHDVDLEDLYGPGTFSTEPVPLREFYLLRWSLDEQGLEVTPIAQDARSEALRPLIKSLGVYGAPDLGRDTGAILAAAASRMEMLMVTGKADILALRDAILARHRSEPAG